MNEQIIETREIAQIESTESDAQWDAVDFVEQSACAEICAYVFAE